MQLNDGSIMILFYYITTILRLLVMLSECKSTILLYCTYPILEGQGKKSRDNLLKISDCSRI